MKKIWITNKIGFLYGYSSVEQPDQIEINIEVEPTDFMNWYWDGKKLIRDLDNAPVLEEELSELDILKRENEVLKSQLASTDEAVLELADIILSGIMKGD